MTGSPLEVAVEDPAGLMIEDPAGLTADDARTWGQAAAGTFVRLRTPIARAT